MISSQGLSGKLFWTVLAAEETIRKSGHRGREERFSRGDHLFTRIIINLNLVIRHKHPVARLRLPQTNKMLGFRNHSTCLDESNDSRVFYRFAHSCGDSCMHWYWTVTAHTEMAVKIDDVMFCDLLYRNIISELFNREATNHIGPQNWWNPIFQSTSAWYRPQTTGIQWDYAYQHVSTSILGTETHDSEPYSTLALTRMTFFCLSPYFIGNCVNKTSHLAHSILFFTIGFICIVMFYAHDGK